ncbi:MAG: acyltransferase [Dysgonomonas sp.]
MIRRIIRLFKRRKNNSPQPNHHGGINMSLGAILDNPMQIDGGKYIRIGENSSIGRYAWLGAFDSYLNQKYTPELIIGSNVRIGNYACITAIGSVQIGDGCLFSEYVYISDHAHGYDPLLNLSPKDQNLNSKGPVKIGKNCFLGYRVCVLPGVTLGCNCVVGANSVVTKSFPDYTMIAGVPARPIKRFSFELNKWININQ